MIEIVNDAQWHEVRARHIGGSDVAALFDCSPYTTKFSLWHEKAGTAPRADVDNQKTRLGKFLEPYIAGELGRTLGWTITPSKHYHIHPSVVGMGCTLDFDIVDHEWGPGICETKVVFDYGDWKKDWSDERAPPNYELQVQHQLAVTGRTWGCIAVLVMQTGTIQPALIRRPNMPVIDAIEDAVRDFWASIAAGQRPEPTGTDAELAIMRHLWPARAPRKVAEVPSGDLNTEASLYRWASDQLAGMERQKTASKARLLAAAEDAELLKVPGFNIGIRQDKRGYVRINVDEVADNGVLPEGPRSAIEAG